MEINADEMLLNALRDGLRTAVADKLKGYQSPLDEMIKRSIENHRTKFQSMLDDAIGKCVNDNQFRSHIADAVNSNLAKTLIQRFGGDVEKQVNALKSDPTTRARITLAIEQIVKDANK